MTISATTQGLRPGVCLSTSRPSAPFDGQLIYETDTDRLAIWNGTAWTYMTGTRFIEWTSFTPTWTNLTVGNGTQSFRYSEHGDIMFIEGVFTLGSTSAVSTNPKLNIPNSRTANNIAIGQNLRLEDAGNNNYMGQIYVGSSTIDLYTFNVAATIPSLAAISSTVPFTWGTGDSMYVGCCFRIVS